MPLPRTPTHAVSLQPLASAPTAWLDEMDMIVRDVAVADRHEDEDLARRRRLLDVAEPRTGDTEDGLIGSGIENLEAVDAGLHRAHAALDHAQDLVAVVADELRADAFMHHRGVQRRRHGVTVTPSACVDVVEDDLHRLLAHRDAPWLVDSASLLHLAPWWDLAALLFAACSHDPAISERHSAPPPAPSQEGTG